MIVVLPVNFLSLASVNSLGLAPRCEEEGCDWEAAAAGVGGVTEAGGWARRSHPAPPPPPPPPSSWSPPLSSDSRDSRGHCPRSPALCPPTLFSFAASDSSQAEDDLKKCSSESSSDTEEDLKECFSGLQTVTPAVLEATSSHSKAPFRGLPESKSKFHLELASFRAFFNSFLTNLRFSSWSVGPNSARFTLLEPEGWRGPSSSSELLLESLLAWEYNVNIADHCVYERLLFSNLLMVSLQHAEYVNGIFLIKVEDVWMRLWRNSKL